MLNHYSIRRLLSENRTTKSAPAVTEAKLVERMAERKVEPHGRTYGALMAEAGIIVAAIKLS